MNVAYVHKTSMTFIGFSTIVAPTDGYMKCPKFWDEEYNKKYARLCKTGKPETAEEKAVWDNGIGQFALCITMQNGSFEYVIAGAYRGGDVPKGMNLYILPESDYATFSTKGPLPQSLQSLNTDVWQKWCPNEGKNFDPNGTTTIEVYSMGDPKSKDYECGIWVPIKKKK